MARLLERFQRDILGLIWAALAVFIALALISFHPMDPSLNSVKSHGIQGAANLCGYVGSFLSDFLYQLFGVASWMLVIGAALRSVSTFQGKATPVSPWRVFWMTLLILVSAALCSLHFPTTKIFGGQISLGGVLGFLVSRGLISVFNPVGVGVILWTSAAVLLVIYTEKRITELFPLITSTVSGVPLFFRSTWKMFWQERTKIEQVKSSVAIQHHLEPIIKQQPKFILNNFFTSKVEKEVPIAPPPPEKVKLAKLKAIFQNTPRQIENWNMPSLEMLLDPPNNRRVIDEREMQRNARLVEQKLAEFDVLGHVVKVIPGPAVTMYEFKPAASTKINDITRLTDDLSLALSAESLRIIAPIPGRDVVGIETSNSKRENIYMKELVESPEFWSEELKLPVALGKGISGEPKIIDLRKIPHLLVAGTTGSGKSVFIMSLVTSLIMRHSPKTLRIIIVDPKQVDLAAFHKIPHLLLPPVKDAKPAVSTLKWLIREMEKRYRSMSKFNSKSIEAFNESVSKLSKSEIESHEEKIKVLEENAQTAMQNYYCKPLPYVCAIIEEFSDLMSVDRAGVEPAAVRLAQMARASGIHLVIAMQSPRREVLTGLIKTNFPGRISFKVASKIDSSIVLDQRGAERLLSVGDMLYLAPGVSQPQRYHGAFLRDDEMNAVTEFWIKQGEPQFEPTAVHAALNSENEETLEDEMMDPGLEEDYDHVVAYVASQKEVSASLLQRRFRFGYPKAARLIEILEHEGVIGPSNGSKPRAVLANKLD